jgi:hypothetical protein
LNLFATVVANAQKLAAFFKFVAHVEVPCKLVEPFSQSRAMSSDRLGARIEITAMLHAWCSAATHHPRVHIQQLLDDADIDAALKQAGRKAVEKRVYRHALLDLSRLDHLMEQAISWQAVIGLFGLRLGNNQRFAPHRNAMIEPSTIAATDQGP